MIVEKRVQEGGLLKLAIKGDLDASSAIEMDEVIKSALGESQFNILVDCKQLNYISSAGLGVFISYLEDFKNNHGGFVFFDMNENVYNVFKLLGLHNIFSIVGNEGDAKKILFNEN